MSKFSPKVIAAVENAAGGVVSWEIIHDGENRFTVLDERGNHHQVEVSFFPVFIGEELVKLAAEAAGVEYFPADCFEIRGCYYTPEEAKSIARGIRAMLKGI